MRKRVGASCALVVMAAAVHATNAEGALQRNLTVRGQGPANMFGQSIDIVGDVDDDGVADFVTGAIGALGNRGRAYVISGAAASTLIGTTVHPAYRIPK